MIDSVWTVHDHVALARGLALGDDSGFSSTLQTAVRALGVQHLTAASGANLAVVTTIVPIIGRHLPSFWRQVFTVGLIAAYIHIAGWSGSLWRAACAWGVSWGCMLIGFRSRWTQSVGAIVVGALLWPSQAATASFILSALAITGMLFSQSLLSGEKCYRYFPQREKWRQELQKSVIVASGIALAVGWWTYWQWRSVVPRSIIVSTALGAVVQASSWWFFLFSAGGSMWTERLYHISLPTHVLLWQLRWWQRVPAPTLDACALALSVWAWRYALCARFATQRQWQQWERR